MVDDKDQLQDDVRDEITHKIKKDELEQDATSRVSRTSTSRTFRTLRTLRTLRRSAKGTDTHQAAPEHHSSPEGADAG